MSFAAWSLWIVAFLNAGQWLMSEEGLDEAGFGIGWAIYVFTPWIVFLALSFVSALIASIVGSLERHRLNQVER